MLISLSARANVMIMSIHEFSTAVLLVTVLGIFPVKEGVFIKEGEV